MFDQGTGPVVVVVPGLHGRWEWMAPALRRLASRCRVISFSLSGDLGSGRAARDFDEYVRQLDEVLDRAGVERATICGISFGGFVALRYAAKRPARVEALVLASSPAPGWHPNPRQARWIARPWLSAPAFIVSSPFRLWPEVCAAHPRLAARIRFFARQGLRAAASPMIPGLMARRIREAERLDFRSDCASVEAPTLVVTGEDGLDSVVPVDNTRTYANLIRNARHEVIQRTGHIGVLTQPDRFADLITGFAHAHHH
jgi:pimeloyl-ACP methyl ester carboxylesterase